MAFDAQGNLYIQDNQTIRKIWKDDSGIFQTKTVLGVLNTKYSGTASGQRFLGSVTGFAVKDDVLYVAVDAAVAKIAL